MFLSLQQSFHNTLEVFYLNQLENLRDYQVFPKNTYHEETSLVLANTHSI